MYIFWFTSALVIGQTRSPVWLLQLSVTIDIVGNNINIVVYTYCLMLIILCLNS